MFSLNQTTSTIILLISGIIGVLLFVMFLVKKNHGQYTGLTAKIHGFLNFRIILAESMFKILYVISATYVTVSAIVSLFSPVFYASVGDILLNFLYQIVVYNVVLRLVYELLIFGFVICKNTTEINMKLNGSSTDIEFNPIKSPAPKPAAAAYNPYGGAAPSPYAAPTAAPSPYAAPAAAPSPYAAPASAPSPYAAPAAAPSPYAAPAAAPKAPTREASFCRNCGKRVEAIETKCSNCGTVV